MCQIRDIHVHFAEDPPTCSAPKIVFVGKIMELDNSPVTTHCEESSQVTSLNHHNLWVQQHQPSAPYRRLGWNFLSGIRKWSLGRIWMDMIWYIWDSIESRCCWNGLWHVTRWIWLTGKTIVLEPSTFTAILRCSVRNWIQEVKLLPQTPGRDLVARWLRGDFSIYTKTYKTPLKLDRSHGRI